MAYLKYKEITKYFDFSKYVEKDSLPQYTLDYIYDDEKILAGYKTFRDYGIFTNKKILLFDNAISINPYKETFTIPYTKISSCSIVFRPSKAELKFDLESGYQLRLKFVNMNVTDKIRLRLLYSSITRIVSNQETSKKIVDSLMKNDIKIKEN